MASSNLQDPPEDVRRYIENRVRAPKRRTILEILEEKHMLTMIEYIDAHSPVMKSEIYNAVSRSSGMAGKISDLEEIGLVSMYSADGMNIVSITDKGRKVAGIIRSMAETIDGWETLA